MTDGPAWDGRAISYQGHILEYGLVNAPACRSPEAVLGSNELASNLAVDKSILADPTGMLAGLQAAVAREYARRPWVTTRCDHLKRAARQSLAELDRAGSAAEALLHLNFLALNPGGLVAVAALKPPTHRRSLCLQRATLASWGWSDLHADVLAVLGWADLSPSQVTDVLQDCAATFDKAVAVTHTPVPYDFKLHAYVRPYVVAGAQAMLDEGCHREAMLWITAFLLIGNNAVQADAAEAERPAFRATVNHLAGLLGLASASGLNARRQQAAAVVDRVFLAADDMVRRNPAIQD